MLVPVIDTNTKIRSNCGININKYCAFIIIGGVEYEPGLQVK
jgi:hypothetical protein